MELDPMAGVGAEETALLGALDKIRSTACIEAGSQQKTASSVKITELRSGFMAFGS
jgi:hypothetical protein